MKIEKIELEIMIDGKKEKAIADKFQVGKGPQYWVYIEGKTNKIPAMTLYEVEKGKFFWFRLPEKNQEIATQISKKLKEYKQRDKV